VGFVVDKVAIRRVYSDYFGFSCQISFHLLLHTDHHPSSGAGTIGQIVADVTSGLSGGQSNTETGFLPLLRFPLPILIPAPASHSSSVGQIVDDVPSGLSLNPLQESKEKKTYTKAH
jgi:hypothetical protein